MNFHASAGSYELRGWLTLSMVLENGGGRVRFLTGAGAQDVIEGSWGGTGFEMECQVVMWLYLP